VDRDLDSSDPNGSMQLRDVVAGRFVVERALGQVRAHLIDSTLKSNLSVGLPIDLLVYQANALRCDEWVCIDEDNRS
jgi:predicted proteasome-type protease